MKSKKNYLLFLSNNNKVNDLKILFFLHRQYTIILLSQLAVNIYKKNNAAIHQTSANREIISPPNGKLYHFYLEIRPWSDNECLFISKEDLQANQPFAQRDF